MVNSVRRLTLLLPVVLSSACGDRGATRVDSAGVEILVSNDLGVWTESSRPVLAEVMRIGSETDSLYQFGLVTGIDLASNGSIVVLDSDVGTIRIYDSSGRYVRSIGRRGQGPGELSESATDMVLSVGDTVLIADAGRVKTMLLDGRELDSFAVPSSASGDVSIHFRWVEHPHGGLVQQVVGEARAADSTIIYPPYHLLLLDPSGAPPETLFTLPGGMVIQPADSVGRGKRRSKGSATRGGTGDESVFTEGGSPDGTPEIRIFAAEPIWTVSDDGAIHYGMTSDYAINMYDTNGVVRRVLRRPWKANPLTDADKAAGLRLLRESMISGGMPAEDVDSFIGSITFADHFPVLIRMLPGPQGTLWVQRARDKIDLTKMDLAPGLVQFASPAWDVFANDGTFMGAVLLPSNFTPFRWVGDQLLGVSIDADHVQQVSILRAQPDGVLRGLPSVKR